MYWKTERWSIKRVPTTESSRTLTLSNKKIDNVLHFDTDPQTQGTPRRVMVAFQRNIPNAFRRVCVCNSIEKGVAHGRSCPIQNNLMVSRNWQFNVDTRWALTTSLLQQEEPAMGVVAVETVAAAVPKFVALCPKMPIAFSHSSASAYSRAIGSTKWSTCVSRSLAQTSYSITCS